MFLMLGETVLQLIVSDDTASAQELPAGLTSNLFHSTTATATAGFVLSLTLMFSFREMIVKQLGNFKSTNEDVATVVKDQIELQGAIKESILRQTRQVNKSNRDRDYNPYGGRRSSFANMERDRPGGIEQPALERSLEIRSLGMPLPATPAPVPVERGNDPEESFGGTNRRADHGPEPSDHPQVQGCEGSRPAQRKHSRSSLLFLPRRNSRSSQVGPGLGKVRFALKAVLSHAKEIDRVVKATEMSAALETRAQHLLLTARYHNVLSTFMWQVKAMAVMLVGTGVKIAMHNPHAPQGDTLALQQRLLLGVSAAVTFGVQMLSAVLRNRHHYTLSILRRHPKHVACLAARLAALGANIGVCLLQFPPVVFLWCCSGLAVVQCALLRDVIVALLFHQGGSVQVNPRAVSRHCPGIVQAVSRQRPGIF